ncbi:TRAP transporter substrate-binding protein [Microbaculum marinisediminis]|uniref:TRAP transporter substrate-binding protein n=1 Tax=Microbaculum marinisediminis TaxID=2931392 RepID=A0AAW5R4K6_9HYPH|nr:TRAP transporter substrate-binding protein [Microbaculum sp. A6E488]MCT8974332.1 TRAP transporter substrate-binding protein [Microbaculum sp. A6E488]
MKYGLCAAVLAAAIAGTGQAQAGQYDLQSVFGLNVPSIGQSPANWAKRVKLMTGGEIDVKVHGAGDFVPPFELFGAVSSGAIPFGYDWIGYWASSIPVANLVGAMPFGPSPDMALGWMFEGGGLEIIQKAYDPHGVKVIPCHLVVSEAGGWFNKDIETVDDLKGLNMRIAGLGGQALARLGANTQLVPAGEIYVSLETGRIDAAEFSAPQLDIGVGFQDIVKNYYFPGWHQPSSWNSIIINMDVWGGFTENQQQIMIEACKANITAVLANESESQNEALEKIEAAGVTVRRLPDEVLAALKESSTAVMEDEAARDPLFKEAYESLTAYMDRMSRWKGLQELPR